MQKCDSFNRLKLTSLNNDIIMGASIKINEIAGQWDSMPRLDLQAIKETSVAPGNL